MSFKITQIKPYISLKAVTEGLAIPLYSTQAELQLLSKLRSQSYKAYIGQLSQLPSSDITTDLEKITSLDIEREEKTAVASSLLPTQREIFLDAVLPKLTKEEIPSYFGDFVELANQPIITFNDIFVIDGHHRWLSICCINPRAEISTINFYSPSLTPIQFLKLLQGAIVMEEGELPTPPKDKYKVDIFHSSNKKILAYVDEEINTDIFLEIKRLVKLENLERAQHYIGTNILSLKYNNLPAIGSPSRELMPQTSNTGGEVLDTVLDMTPVLTTGKE